MRKRLITSLVIAGACSVPDKQPLIDGGNSDGSNNTGPIQTTITGSPGEFSATGTATFEFSSNRSTASFLCSFDGEPASPCTSPLSRSLADGTHNFSVRAVDADGHRDDTPAEHLWSIDTVAPITTLTEAPPAADNSEIVRFLFISNEMSVVFECSLDNVAFAACASGDTFGPITDGAHAFSVRAKDRAGNVDTSPAIHAWSVDTSTPDTQLIAGPDGAQRSQSASFSFVSPDAGAGATFECSLDGGPWSPCLSPQDYSNLAMGVHAFAVRVRDAVGNFDPTPATRTWIVDFTPPETAMLTGPSGAVSMASASFTFTANEVDVSFACSLDGGAFGPCTSPFNAMMLAQGAHTFSVAATDAAGNVDDTPATSTWTVDTLPPDVAITGGPDTSSIVGPRVVYTFTVSEGTVECLIDDARGWFACGSPFGFNSAEGPRNFSVRAIDAAGNVTMLSRSFHIACSAPDPTGSFGTLHLDDGDQIVDNATGGAAATLGPTDQVEASDPAAATARFGGGLSFNAAEGDLVAWPLAAGATAGLSLEVWALPSALSGTRDVVISGDGRVALRVMAVDTTNVQFSATLVDDGGVSFTVTSLAVPADAWHFVQISMSDPLLRLWVDGDRYERGDARPGTATSLDSLRLGGNFGGALDEVWLSPSAFDDEAALQRFCPTAGFTL